MYLLKKREIDRAMKNMHFKITRKKVSERENG
jgi:hypothetical protein